VDNRSSILVFVVVVLLFAFSHVFAVFTLVDPVTTFTVLALIGYSLVLFTGLAFGTLLTAEGVAISLWFYAVSLVSGILLVWFVTKIGSAAGVL